MHSEDQETRKHVFKMLFYRISKLDKILLFKRIQYRTCLENFMCLELLLLSIGPPQILNSFSNINFIVEKSFFDPFDNISNNKIGQHQTFTRAKSKIKPSHTTSKCQIISTNLVINFTMH